MISEKQFSKLKKSIEWSEQQLDFSRKKRIEFLKQFVGVHNCQNAATKEVPVNFLALYIQVLLRQLAPKTPRVMLSTKDTSLKPTCYDFELVLNEIPKEIGLDQSYRRWVLDALFAPYGIVKVGLSSGDKLFVDNVSYDDYFCDMSATTEDQLDYEGNSYWLDIEDARKRYDKPELRPDEYTPMGVNGEERAEGLSVTSSADVYKDKIRVKDVYIPSEKTFLTYSTTSGVKLDERQWTGPRPYYKLWYLEIPGSILPLPPVALIFDIHNLSNSVFRKLGDQAQDQKTVYGLSGANPEEIAAARKAKDDTAIQWSGDKVEELKFGGVDAKTLAFWLQLKEIANYYAGNIDSTGGLAVQAGTLGQEQLLNQAAGAQLRDMMDKTIAAIKEVFKAIAHYEWNKPNNKRKFLKPVPGLNPIVSEWNNDRKQGKFEDYQIDIDIYSLQDDSPGLKLQRMIMFLQQIVSPLLPMMQQDGCSLNYTKIIEDASRYMNDPGLRDLVSVIENFNPGQQQGMSTPQITHREYTRTGRPGQTKSGTDRAMSQLLLGGNPGGEE